MPEQPPDDDDLWIGSCLTCGARYQVFNTALLQKYPQYRDSMIEADKITVDCSECEPPPAFVTLSRQSVKMVPFSAWQVLPPESGCLTCGTEHEPDLPHDHSALHYHYAFRLAEEQAGRPGRWPTWHDAMAHCTPEMKEAWLGALRRQGVEI